MGIEFSNNFFNKSFKFWLLLFLISSNWSSNTITSNLLINAGDNLFNLSIFAVHNNL